MKTSPTFVGPISTGSPVRVSAGAVQGKGKMPPMSPVSGKGSWIWLGGNPTSARFRKEVELSSVPKSGLVRVSAETSYRLYVNGHLVSRGPADVGRDYDIGPTGPWMYDVVDVRRYLKSGTNTFCAEVIARPIVQSEAHLGKPGFWFEADLGSQRLGSGTSWKAALNSDLTFEPGGKDEPVRDRGELMTLTGLPERDNWLDGLGGAWQPAKAVPDAGRPLRQSEIPPPMEAVYPAVGYERAFGGAKAGEVAEFTSDGGCTIRFDRVLSAHIIVRVDGGEGAILCVMPNEKNENGFNRAVRLKLGKGVQYFEVPFFDSFSVINLQAVGVTKPFSVEAKAVFRSYPVTYAGEFECSDPHLNRLWSTGRWLTQICMQTHHLDSPHHQEPISDPGDYLIQSLISYATFGESALARQDLRKYAQIIRDRKGRVFHTSYALLWLQMLIAYWHHTGDESLVRELAPTALELVDIWETWRGANGLISNPPNFMFIDWVELEGFNLHHPPAVIGQGVLTAFYYRSLQDAAQIAGLLGNKALEKELAVRRRSVREAFNRELWSSDKQRFRDGKPGQSQTPLGPWLPADKPIETFSSQVNILACAYGLAPSTVSKEVLSKVMESGPAACQPYFMHFAFEALLETGLYDTWAGSQMRRWKIVPGAESMYEMWDRGDLSHSWQCTPTYQLSSRVLGVSPASPGFKETDITPHLLDLDWAKGQVPTPLGTIKVSWHRNADTFRMSVVIPKAMKVLVELPDGTKRSVAGGAHEFTCRVGKRPSLN